MGPFVTISGATVDATLVIDALVGKIAELSLENASLRAQVSTWSTIAQSEAMEAQMEADQASEAPVEATPGATETPPPAPDAWDGRPPT